MNRRYLLLRVVDGHDRYDLGSLPEVADWLTALPFDESAQVWPFDEPPFRLSLVQVTPDGWVVTQVYPRGSEAPWVSILRQLLVDTRQGEVT